MCLHYPNTAAWADPDPGDLLGDEPVLCRYCVDTVPDICKVSKHPDTDDCACYIGHHQHTR